MSSAKRFIIPAGIGGKPPSGPTGIGKGKAMGMPSHGPSPGPTPAAHTAVRFVVSLISMRRKPSDSAYAYQQAHLDRCTSSAYMPFADA